MPDKMRLSILPAAVFLLAASAQAQGLFDPNQRCFTDASGHCATQAPQGPYQRPPISSSPYGQSGETQSCPAMCKAQQDQCTAGCQQSSDFYSCFSRCGDQHTLCIHNECGQ